MFHREPGIAACVGHSSGILRDNDLTIWYENVCGQKYVDTRTLYPYVFGLWAGFLKAFAPIKPQEVGPLLAWLTVSVPSQPKCVRWG